MSSITPYVDTFLPPPPPTPPLFTDDQLGGNIQRAVIEERPYLGLRDVWGMRGDCPEVSELLRSCERENAWPDWVGYFRKAEQSGQGPMEIAGSLVASLHGAGWRQSFADVLLERDCRANKKFVTQCDCGVTCDSGGVLKVG